MKLRSKIHEMVKKRGYRKSWVAEQVGVSTTQFSLWDNNKKTGYIKSVPSALNIMLLMNVLDCGIEDLLELVEE